MKSVTATGALEIAVDPRIASITLLEKALGRLRISRIGGRDVLGVVADRCDQTLIPCFGHSVLCKKRCRRPIKPHGVRRYFPVHVVLEGPGDISLVGMYEVFRDCRYGIWGYVETESNVQRVVLRRTSRGHQRGRYHLRLPAKRKSPHL